MAHPFPARSPALRQLALQLLLVASTALSLHAVDRTRLGGASKDSFLTGDWCGRRTAWSAQGFDVGLAYTAAGYENISGGLREGGAVEGTSDLNLDLDLAKLAGWNATRLHVSAVGAHGTSISSGFVGDVNKLSSFYLERGVYLHEVWLEKTWFDQKLSLRAGKISLDLEFPIYSYADTIPLPLYPSGALGTRLAYSPNPAWTFRAAVYDGDPTEPGRGLNRHGTHVRLARGDGATFAAEAGFSFGYAPESTLLAGTWKIGAYHSTRPYADVRTGLPHRGNHAVYLNGDQTLWRENPAKKGDAQGLALYLVAEAAPTDRNTYHYGHGGGPYYTGPLPGRDADVLYFNYLYTRFGPPYSAASHAAGGPRYFFENRWQLNYQIVLTKFFSVTPEFNYVVRAGGTTAAPHATVLGLRTNLTF